MATVRELVTRLGFEADTQQARKYDQTLDGVKQTARRAALAVGALGTAAGALVYRFSSDASVILNWSERLGLAVEEMQRLEFAAQQFNIGQERLIDGIKELSLRTDEYVKTGAGPAAEAFERMNLSASELNEVTNDTGALFSMIRERMSGVQNAAARQRIADELFGGQAGEKFPEFMSQSREEIERLFEIAEKSGAVVPRETLERARAFSRETRLMRTIIGGFADTLSVAMLPAFRDLVQTTNQWFMANREIIQQKMRRIVDGIGFSLRMVSAIIWTFVRAANEAAEALGGWERTIRLVTIGLGVMAGARILRGIKNLATAIWGVFFATGAVSGAVRTLRNLLLIGFIAAVIEDLYNWVNANESVAGQILGPWEDFKASWNLLWSDIQNRPGRAFRTIAKMAADGARRFMRNFVGALPGGSMVLKGSDFLSNNLLTGSNRDPMDDMGRASHSRQAIQVNAKTEATLQVPQGTSEEQRNWLEGMAESIFSDHWDREIRRSLWDFQPVE